MILQGNSLQLLKDIESDSIDFILTDPPYGINYSSPSSSIAGKTVANDNPDDIDWDILLKELYRVLKPKGVCFIFGRMDMFMRIGSNIINSDFKYNHDFIWRKGDMRVGNLSAMGTIHENGLVLSKGVARACNPIYINQEIKKRYKAEYNGKISRLEFVGHPTQKPVNLLSYLIQAYSNEGDIVLDPFMGSGSTIVASYINNRKYIGIDLEEEYINITNKRLKDINMLNLYGKQIRTGFIYTDEGLLQTNKLK
jgi:DNA modification methylase